MPTRRPSSPPSVEVIDPLWLIKAVAITLVAALVCGWLALCLLFYQGQWQFVLHPQQSTQPLLSFGGFSATPVRFDAADTGVPRLSGALLLPSGTAGLTPYTVLYLRGGEGSLARSTTDAETISMLHSLNLAVFAFDYRGFGDSDSAHPSLRRMTQDTQAALRYLLSRGIPESRLVLYGTGVGASLATTLAVSHPTIPALVLDSPTGLSLDQLRADPRTRALPVRWLFHENFSLDQLASLNTPKLLISFTQPGALPPAAFASAASPKMTLQVPYKDRSRLAQAVKRFLDQYLATDAFH